MNDAPEQNDQEKLNGSIVTEGNDKVAEEGAGEVEQKAAAGTSSNNEDSATKEKSEIGELKADTNVTDHERGIEASTNEPKRRAEAGAEPQTEKKAEGTDTAGASKDAEADAEPTSATTDTKSAENSTTAQPSSETPAVLPSPSHTHNSLRPLSPSSRTSTPPLTGTIAPTAKKFSAINVNKKFLSKTGTSPSPSSASPSTKLNSLSNRPAASPVPIAPPSSRLLSTKLTTVSSTKPSTSPQPPSSASTSSPWAKHSLPQPSSASSLQQSSDGRMTMGGSGDSQGSARPAWRAVNADGKRTAMGMSRDFPTAKEVADGKQASVTAAQVQAAQAAAILQGLDAFSHLDQTAHRWDDDDDEDDVIDFGGDPLLHPPPAARQPPAPPRQQPQTQQQPPTEKPVSKSERFAEDFDRSWPRSAQQAAEEAQRAPDLRKRESDRVLFNASSNRLENPSSRPTPTQPPQPTRLMSRSENPPAPAPSSASVPHTAAPAGGRLNQRQPPPHLANSTDTGRQLPPHMADSIPSRPPPPSTSHQSQSGRIPWSNNRDTERHAPPHMANRPDLPPQSSAFETSRSPPTGPGSALPPRRSFGQATSTHMAPPPSQQQPQPPHATPAADPTDSQAAEMHSAAEKARLRREAEEVERKAAAERAKQKAREMEARLGPKSTPRSGANTDTPLPTQPPTVAQTPSYTIAQRPKPTAEPVAAAQAAPSGSGPNGRRPSVNQGPLLRRPSIEQSRGGREDQWRVRDTPKPHGAAPSPSIQHDQTTQHQTSQQPRTTVPSHHQRGRPTAASFFDQEQEQSPPNAVLQTPQAGPSTRIPTDAEVQALFDDVPGEESGKADYMFDDTLARIKAAMGGSKANANESATSTSGAQGGRQRVSDSVPAQPPAASATKTAPPPPRRQPTPVDFTTTQPAIPRSPPPAWRTYVVKLPKESKPVPAIPQPQLNTLKRTKKPAPGWLMSFNPPLDLPLNSLSRTDLLLPGSSSQRLSRGGTVEPRVNVSQGSLEPVVKKGDRHPSQPYARSGPSASTEPPTAHQLQSRSAGRWRQTDEAASATPEPVSTQATIDLLDAPAPVTAKSPAKPAPATSAQPEPSASARYEGVNAGPSANVAASAATSDPKSGVRFMVSSELEGDSLLDEVNKMSLETVEEAGMKDRPLGTQAGIDAPRSPVSHNGPNAVRTHPSSPNGTVTWNTSHEHLKNVWQQTPQSSGDPQSAVPSGQSAVPDTVLTPLYPSLNPLSATDSNSTQTNQNKLSYSSQTFSPSSATFSSLRHSPATVGYAPSPNNVESMAGLSYARNPQNVNGYSSMSQQGLWSAPGFASSTMGTPGYGYTAKSPNAIDQKAAMAFNSAAGGGSPYVYGQTGGYTSLPSAHSPYGQYTSSHAQQQHQSRASSATNGTYGYAGYAQTGSGSRSMSGRFAQQANGGGGGGGGNEYGQADGGAYYGYVGGGQSAQHPQQSQSQTQHQQQQQQQASQSQGQGQGMYYQTSPAGHGVGAGAVGQQQPGGQRRKMW